MKLMKLFLTYMFLDKEALREKLLNLANHQIDSQSEHRLCRIRKSSMNYSLLNIRCKWME